MEERYSTQLTQINSNLNEMNGTLCVINDNLIEILLNTREKIKMETNEITTRNVMNAEEKAIFDWQYRQMGSFRKNLMEAICRADEDNLERLELGFPNEVRGYLKYGSVAGWWDEVKRKAKAKGWIE